MKRFVAALILVLVSAPARAETCPVKHPALTGLDRASMAAAYEVSFIGAECRTPTWTRGAGKDDGEYLIAVSKHFGEYGYGSGRSGWIRYRGLRMTWGWVAMGL